MSATASLQGTYHVKKQTQWHTCAHNRRKHHNPEEINGPTLNKRCDKKKLIVLASMRKRSSWTLQGNCTARILNEHDDLAAKIRSYGTSQSPLNHNTCTKNTMPQTTFPPCLNERERPLNNRITQRIIESRCISQVHRRINILGGLIREIVHCHHFGVPGNKRAEVGMYEELVGGSRRLPHTMRGISCTTLAGCRALASSKTYQTQLQLCFVA